MGRFIRKIAGIVAKHLSNKEDIRGQELNGLNRKYIWEFALSQEMWNKPIDVYMALELERRMMLFFDRAAYYIATGYEKDRE